MAPSVPVGDGVTWSRSARELAWVLVLGISIALGIGRHALVDPDEGRNAAIGSEMAASADFLIPHLNGLPFLDKPPMFFAAEALAMRALGSSERAARLPSLVFAWATIALTAWFSSQLFGRPTAWIAATAAATAPLAMAMARTAIFDTMLTFFMTLAICGFHRAIESDEAGRRAAWRPGTLLGWTAIALGVLTKGPVALLVPLLVAAPYAAWRRRSIAVWHPSGWLLFLGLVAPWALLVEQRIPGFLRYALLTETWGRLTTGELQRTGPIWYFVPYLLVGFFPWIVVVAAAARGRWREPPTSPPAQRSAGSHNPVILLLLWIALPLLLFSLSQSKRPQYILVLAPAVAMLAAWVWSGPAPPRRGVRAAALGWMLLGAAAIWAPSAPRWVELDGRLATVAKTPSLAVGLVAVACGSVAWWMDRRRGAAVVLLSLPAVAIVLLSAAPMAEIARLRSTRDAANAIRPHLTADTRLLEIEMFSPSLGFYLSRPTQSSTASAMVMGSNFIGRFAHRLGSPRDRLVPAGSWIQAATACETPTIFVFRERQRGERTSLAAAGLRVLFERDGLVVMGPCGATPAAQSPNGPSGAAGEPGPG